MPVNLDPQVKYCADSLHLSKSAYFLITLPILNYFSDWCRYYRYFFRQAFL